MAPAHGILLRLRNVREPYGAEIGVADGATSALLLSREDLRLLMVDNWLPEGSQPEAYKATGDCRALMSRAEQRRAAENARRATDFAAERRTIVRQSSLEAAERTEDASLDFVFIDADHSYEGCKADIEAWTPKVKPGGLISGHDYPGIEGVKRAVDEWAEATGLRVISGPDRMWYATKENGCG